MNQGNYFRHAHATIVGCVAAVPATVITNADCPDQDDAEAAARLTGVHERRWVSSYGNGAYGLNLAAAKRLLERMGWEGSTLASIVYVTQTPTRKVPADVYSLAAELGADCPCIQVNWSCAGYVYGLWLAMTLAQPGTRVLLVVGDATSTICDPGDRATAPLFGDAGSATAIIGGGPRQCFVLGTDGTGAEHLSQERNFLQMDGASVFNFTLRKVPPMVDDLNGMTGKEPDLWLVHQANEFMLKHIVKKCAIPADRVPINIGRFGNTSCASVPLVLCTLAKPLPENALLGMLGFGSGWAWGGAVVQSTVIEVRELLEVP